MNLQTMVDKYKKDSNPTRLDIILQANNKKVTKQNLEAIKLLIDDDDMSSLVAFLGISPENIPLVVPVFEHNQDDFTHEAIRVYGKIENENSLGHEILDNKKTHWFCQSYYPPDKLLRRWASLVNKEGVEVDFFTNHKSLGVPVWECCILGTFKINRVLQTIIYGNDN